MPGMINHEKAFVKLFSQTARYHHRFKVFEDFISCSVIALENRLHFSEVREQKYLRTVGGYEKEDVTRMAQLLAHVVGVRLENGIYGHCLLYTSDAADERYTV